MGDWIIRTISSTGFFGIVLLMLVENVFPPIPSELIMPLAGYLASTGQMNFMLVVVAGTLGSVLGAVALYALGRRIGPERLKSFADRHGRWLTLSRADIERADGWFKRHGAWAVFACRLVPGIRSLISIPAGIDRMPWVPFLVATTLGSALWSAVLAGFGYALGARFEQVGEVINPISTAVVVGCLAWYLWRVVRHQDNTTGAA